MFEVLGFLTFLLIVALAAAGFVVCGALTGFGMLFDAVGGVFGAVFGLVVFCILMVGLAVLGLGLGLLSWIF